MTINSVMIRASLAGTKSVVSGLGATDDPRTLVLLKTTKINDFRHMPGHRLPELGTQK
jgi:hypothetical protein